MAIVRDLSGNAPANLSATGIDPHVTAVEDDIGSVVALTPGTPINGGRGLDINCTVAGDVKVQYVDNTTFTYAVSVGTTRIMGNIEDVVAAGTTATATYGIIR